MRELLQQALAALKTCDVDYDYDENPYDTYDQAAVEDAIEALEHELNKPKQEPVALERVEQYRMQMAAISTAAIGYWKEGDNIHQDYNTIALRDVAKLYAKYSELYTAPPKREWQGLTDEEIENLWNSNNWDIFGFVIPFTQAIEAKLKEKNT